MERWRQCPKDPYRIELDCIEAPIATVHVARGMAQEARRNARIIANAPRLLDACERLVQEVEWVAGERAIAAEFGVSEFAAFFTTKEREAWQRAQDTLAAVRGEEAAHV